MLRLIADENFHAVVFRGVMRRVPDLDFQRAQDAGLLQTPDPIILDWAAARGRLVVTHDVNTMPGHAYARVHESLPMPGVVVVRDYLPHAQAIEELITFATCSREGEWEGQVIFLPL